MWFAHCDNRHLESNKKLIGRHVPEISTLERDLQDGGFHDIIADVIRFGFTIRANHRSRTSGEEAL